MPRLPSMRRADVWVAVLATALQIASPRPGSAPPPPDVLTGVLVGALAIAAALVQGIALLRRRSRPVVVLVVCVAAYIFSLATAPGVPPYAAWFALFAAGVYAQPARRAGYTVAAGSAALIAIVLAGALFTETSAGDVIVIVLATVIVALVATLVRARRGQIEALRERADALQRESESAAARAAAEERLRIARDIHDLVGMG
jgi:signal transduction histidine kinase